MVKIHFNDTALRHIAQHRTADREGRLLYRSSKDSYRERWFRLCGNLLFYFRTNDLGAVVDMSDPVGVLVLAACHVQMEEYGDRPFVFSVVFSGEEGRKHFFSGQSQQQCLLWVDALRGCGYSELQTQLVTLQSRIKQLSGVDPMLAKINISKPPKLAPESAGGAAKFYVSSSRDNDKETTTGPPVPTRRAPSRPTKSTQPLVQLLEPTSGTDTPQVHNATTKATTFPNWETFN